MKKTTYDVYSIYVETPRKHYAPHLTNDAARNAILDAFLDNEKPVASFTTEKEAAAYIAAQGTGWIEEHPTFWRVHAYVAYETDVTTDEDGDVVEETIQGATCVSDFPGHDISINNGRTYCTPAEAVAALPWDTIVNAMDDDTRETVASMGYDDPEEFLSAYLRHAPCDLIIG